MPSCLVFILLISPWIAACAIALHNSQSWLSVLVVVLGAIAGAILITLCGIHWLQIFHRSWLESQAVGFIFVPVILPFYAYTGSVTGVSLVAILYSYKGIHSPEPIFQMVAIGLTVMLGGLIPSAIAAIIFISTQVSNFAVVPIFAIGIGVASSWFASQLAYLLVANLYQ